MLVVLGMQHLVTEREGYIENFRRKRMSAKAEMILPVFWQGSFFTNDSISFLGSISTVSQTCLMANTWLGLSSMAVVSSRE
jgi:hypothetical protein